MTQEEKDLLLKDLCARLPYGVKVQNIVSKEIYDLKDYLYCLPAALITNFKPYLRPMSNMTEEERKESREWLMLSSDREGNRYFDGFGNVSAADILKGIDWLNSHHFDYRGLIEKGLALEAPEGMYKAEELK